jgi:hypothetical protein
MKKNFYFLFLTTFITIIFTSCGSNSRKNIPKTGSFGEVIDMSSKFYNPADTTNIKEQFFTGEIVNYCKGEGCWLSLKNENGSPILVEVKDKSFVLPLEINGSTAYIKGELKYSPSEKYDLKITATGLTIK